jgi:hypothetical protein
MTERERRRFPAWAERERTGDLAWIKENLHVFWPVAQQGYEEHGRGAIVVDTTLALPVKVTHSSICPKKRLRRPETLTPSGW